MPTSTLPPSKPIGDKEYVLVDRHPPTPIPTSTCSVTDTGHAAAITKKPLQNLPGRTSTNPVVVEPSPAPDASPRPPSGEERLEAIILTMDAKIWPSKIDGYPSIWADFVELRSAPVSFSAIHPLLLPYHDQAIFISKVPPRTMRFA